MQHYSPSRLSKVNPRNVSFFENLRSVIELSEGKLDTILKKETTGHLESPRDEFQYYRYFSELAEEETNFVQTFLCSFGYDKHSL